MAIRGPFKRWRLVEPIRDLEDVTKILRELEDAYEKLVYVLEQGTDDAPGTGDAPSDAEYVLGAADADLPNGRVLVSGVNTTVDLGTPGEASVDVVGAPPTGVASGDLGNSYPNPIVDGLLGRPFASTLEPQGNSLIFYNTVQNNWNAVPVSGDLLAVSSGAATVMRIRGNQVEAGTPAAGDLYRWGGSQFVRWSPKYMTATLSVNQTTVGLGSHVEFDMVGGDSGHILLSTGAGQAQGIFTVPAGVWQITLVVNANYSAATGIIGLDLLDASDDSALGVVRARDSPYSDTAQISRAPISAQVVELASAADVKAEIVQNTNVSAIQSATHISFTALA